MSSIRTRAPGHRWIAWTLVCAAAGIGTGFPLSPPVIKDRRVAFPCESHACGCTDSTTCWSRCSCCSEQEKLAWAAARGLSPPTWYRPTRMVRCEPTRDRTGLESATCCTDCGKADSRTNLSRNTRLVRELASASGNEVTGALADEADDTVADNEEDDVDDELSIEACPCFRPRLLIASFAPVAFAESNLSTGLGTTARELPVAPSIFLPIESPEPPVPPPRLSSAVVFFV